MRIMSIPTLLILAATLLHPTNSNQIVNSSSSTLSSNESQIIETGRMKNIDNLIDTLSDKNISFTNTSYQYATNKWIFNNYSLQLDEDGTNFLQRFALGTMYFATDGENWNVAWNLTKNECEWSGVLCDDNGNVIKVILVQNGLNGVIPSDLSYLLYLKVLNLRGNALYGTIPTELGLLSSLEILDLGINGLIGTISTEFGLLSHLKQLHFRVNSLYGTIPTQLGLLSSLQNLFLGANDLTGTIPYEFGLLSSLQKLALRENHINGTIPSVLSSLSSLDSLVIFQNDITGTIPSVLGLSSSLKVLYLNHNRLTGVAPTELVNINDVKLEGNEGLIKTRFYLMKFYKITNGDQWKNNIGWFSNSYIKCYDFKSKSFCYIGSSVGTSSSASTPCVIFNLPNPETTYGQHKNGQNEYYSCTWYEQNNLDWECGFYGITCDENGISKIELSNNFLDGTIISEIGYLEKLKFINLDGNRLKGYIPLELGNLKLLKSLSLSHNFLGGTIPLEVKALLSSDSSNLSTLRIQQNNIVDSLEIKKNNNITVIADCGKSLTSEPLIKCTGCTICCQSQSVTSECILMDRTFPSLQSPFSTKATELPTFSLFAVSVIFLSVVFSFFSIVCYLIFWKNVKHVSSDVIKTFQEISVYKFLLSRNKAAFIIAMFSIMIQLWIIYNFLSASDYTSKISDWVYELECPPGEECESNIRIEWHVWILFAIIVGLFLSIDFVDGWRMMCLGFKDWDWRNFFAGFVVFTVTLLSFVSSCLYNYATAMSSTDILINSVVIIFLTDLDEKLYQTLKHCYPRWVDNLQLTLGEIEILEYSIQTSFSSNEEFRDQDEISISHLEPALETKNTQIIEMKTSISNCKKASLETISNQISQLQTSMSNCERFSERNETRISFLETSLETLNNQISQLQTIISNCEKFRERNETRMSSFETSLETQSNPISQLNIPISEVEKHNTKLENSNEELNELSIDLKDSNTELKKSYEKLKKEMDIVKDMLHH